MIRIELQSRLPQSFQSFAQRSGKLYGTLLYVRCMRERDASGTGELPLETGTVTQPAIRTRTGSWGAKAVRNVLSNWATYLVSGGVSFFLSPYIVRHLGNSAYGVWVLLVSLTGYLGFLDLGIRGAVTRYIAKFHAQADHDGASRTVSSACGMFLTLGLLAVLASIFVSVFAVPHFQIPPDYARAARVVVIITGFNVALSLTSGVFGGVLVGLQRFDCSIRLRWEHWQFVP